MPLLFLLLVFYPAAALSGGAASGESALRPPAETKPGMAPDLRGAGTRFKVQRGNFVAVPIPISDPTLGTGLVVGAAYFYPQTETQKKSQPASVTAVAGMYTSNKSYAYAIGQQNYWGGDRWRFSGALGRANLNLDLLASAGDGGQARARWLVDGRFLYADIARAVAGQWFVGLTTRLVEIDQTFKPSTPDGKFGFRSEIRSLGVGLNVKLDSRDLPLNSYRGQLLEVKSLFNDEKIGSDRTYQSYTAALRSYHSLSPKLVVAWELEGCAKRGSVPLWDACRLGLRGFPATEYMARSSASAQVEARWRFAGRWGAVAFAGGGTVNNSLAPFREDDLVPSAGLGLRWMVLPAKRINLRLDYGRTRGGEAIYFSVGEAF